MAVADRHDLPVAVHIESATPHEVKLAVPTLVAMVIPEAPQNLVGDNAYDSDKLDSELSRCRIGLGLRYNHPAMSCSSLVLCLAGKSLTSKSIWFANN